MLMQLQEFDREQNTVRAKKRPFDAYLKTTNKLDMHSTQPNVLKWFNSSLNLNKGAW